MNLVSCQTSEDDWLVVGHNSTDTWTDEVGLGGNYNHEMAFRTSGRSVE